MLAKKQKQKKNRMKENVKGGRDARLRKDEEVVSSPLLLLIFGYSKETLTKYCLFFLSPSFSLSFSSSLSCFLYIYLSIYLFIIYLSPKQLFNEFHYLLHKLTQIFVSPYLSYLPGLDSKGNDVIKIKF